MHQGHHGANHPVMDYTTGKVEIVSMNHGFAVDVDTLPANAKERTLAVRRIELRHRADRPPGFSVQHHPETSPGPQDSHYLFHRFVEMMTRPTSGDRRLCREGVTERPDEDARKRT